MNTNKITNTIIFGLNDYAQLASYYLRNDSLFRVSGFCIEENFAPALVFDEHGLPIYMFESLLKEKLPDTNMYIPVRDNVQRSRLYDLALNAGYTLISYISSKALVNGNVGKNCFIQEFNNIQPYAQVANNVVMWAGNHIGHHSIIEDDVTITSHCVISGHCRIGQGAYLGVNCTIRDGVTIGAGAVIGMGAVVTKDVAPGVTVVGNPAKPI